MSAVDHAARRVWAKTDRGRIRCAYMSRNAKPAPADVQRLEDEIAAASRVHVTLNMSGPRSTALRTNRARLPRA